MIFTLGHSTHTTEAFLAIAKGARLDGIIDVRSHPTSRWPWWRAPATGEWLRDAGLQYIHEPRLGGWTKANLGLAEWAADRGVDLGAYAKGYFPKQRIGVAKLPNQPTLDGEARWVSGWTNQGLHDYSWYTATDEFGAGLADLVRDYGSSEQPRMAMICAEACWWKCHRSMIADALTFQGVRVSNLMPGRNGVGRASWHDGTPRYDRYPDEVLEVWTKRRAARA